MVFLWQYDKEKYTKIEEINERIKNAIDPYDRKKKLVIVPIDNNFPEFIYLNKERLKDLIY